MHMVKQVSLSEEAYERLRRAKKGDESFSDVVLRTVKALSGNIARFFGAWKEEKEESYASIKAKILEDRKRSRSRDVRF